MKACRLLLVCLLLAAPAGCLVSKKVHTRLLSEKSALEVEKQRLERELGLTRGKLDTCEKGLTDCEGKLADVRKENSEQKNRILALEREAVDLKAKYIDDMEVATAKQQELSRSLRTLEEQSSEESKILLAQLEELREKYDRDLKAKNAQVDALKARHRSEVEALNNRMALQAREDQATIERLEKRVVELESILEKQKAAVQDLSAQADQLEQKLKEEIEKGEIRLKRYKTKMIINIDNSICFDSGSAILKKDVKHSLDKIAESLRDFPDNNIQIEGHTDNVPIHTARFPSNWELSAARALAVLRYLENRKILDPQRLSAVGYGQYHPIVPNDTAENRRLNRRVDIVILPK